MDCALLAQGITCVEVVGYGGSAAAYQGQIVALLGDVRALLVFVLVSYLVFTVALTVAVMWGRR